MCLDSAPEGVGAATEDNGAQITFVEAAVDSAAALGYAVNQEITCAQCTVASATGGSAYTRFGRTQCPAGHSVVYAGIGAGSYFDKSGGTNQYVCLPPNPEYLLVSTADDATSSLSRIEYQLGTSPRLAYIGNGDASCAVCQRPKASSIAIMIPGKLSCPVGAVIDYIGLLVAQNKVQYKTDFTCLDRDPVAAGDVAGNNNGALMYPVEMESGVGQVIQPGGYRNFWELPCVVCSRSWPHLCVMSRAVVCESSPCP